VSILVCNVTVQVGDCFAVHSQYPGNGHAYWRADDVGSYSMGTC